MIGIFGGTFSPIHYGHLLMAEHIREEYQLDRIIFVPALKPPHKDFKRIIEAQDRLEMVKLAISSNPCFDVSDIELKRQGASYTVDTLKELKTHYGGTMELGLIIGADSLVQIETWKSYREIMRLAALIVAARPDTDEILLNETLKKFKNDFNAIIYKSTAASMNYSSTDIRERVRNGQSIRYRVPPEVSAYIEEKGLYM